MTNNLYNIFTGEKINIPKEDRPVMYGFLDRLEELGKSIETAEEFAAFGNACMFTFVYMAQRSGVKKQVLKRDIYKLYKMLEIEEKARD